MKNTLAENMLRFGVKNLSESNIKKIEESVLTEVFSGPFEQAFPDYKLVNAAYKKAYAAGESKPAPVAGKYHYFYTIGKMPEDSYNQYEIGIIGLGLRKFKDMYIPDIAGIGNEGVTAYWDDIRGLKSNSNWPDFLKPDRSWDLLPNENTTISDLANINSRLNSIPAAQLQAMLAQYPKLVAALATMKTNTNWVNRQKFYAGLSGNAKMFYGTAAV